MTVLRDDRVLLDGFRAGEREALSRVYWHYVDVVSDVVRRGVVLSRGEVRGLPAEDVGDLVQETFCRAFSETARLAYDGLRPFRPYLLTICRNLVIDWARQRGRELPAGVDLDTYGTRGDGSQAASPDADPEPWADPKTMRVVETYIGSLQPPVADVYRLRFMGGESQAATAEALGLGRQRVRTLEKQIRAGLAAALERAGLLDAAL